MYPAFRSARGPWPRWEYARIFSDFMIATRCLLTQQEQIFARQSTFAFPPNARRGGLVSPDLRRTNVLQAVAASLPTPIGGITGHAHAYPPARRSSDDPVALGSLAARCRRRIRVTVVQRPQHGNAGHHDNAALLGGRDRGNLPVLALGFCRWQRKDINARIGEGSNSAISSSRYSISASRR
jgi:hypothetical protein